MRGEAAGVGASPELTNGYPHAGVVFHGSWTVVVRRQPEDDRDVFDRERVGQAEVRVVEREVVRDPVVRHLDERRQPGVDRPTVEEADRILREVVVVAEALGRSARLARVRVGERRDRLQRELADGGRAASELVPLHLELPAEWRQLGKAAVAGGTRESRQAAEARDRFRRRPEARETADEEEEQRDSAT